MGDKKPPEGWKRGKLSDLAALNPDSWEPQGDGTILYLDIASISGPGKIGALSEMRSTAAPSRARRKARAGDVLVSTVRPYLKAFARLAEVPNNLVISTGFAVIRPRNPADSLFLYQQVLTEDLQRHLQPRMTGTGYPAVRPKDIGDFPMLIPPPEERCRIAGVLDSIDAAINKTEAVVEASERLRTGLLQELLTRGVPGYHTAWKDEPGVGTIPACWQVVRLGEFLASAEYGTNAALTDAPLGVAVLRMGNLNDGELSLDSTKWAELDEEERAELLLRPGDILFNRTNSIDLVGKVAIVRDVPFPMSFASYLVRLRVDPGRANAYWLIALLNSARTQARLRRLATKGASQANINPTNLRSLVIGLPPRQEQERIAGMVEACRSKLIQERDTLSALHLLKESLSADLLSGRVRVPDMKGVIA